MDLAEEHRQRFAEEPTAGTSGSGRFELLRPQAARWAFECRSLSFVPGLLPSQAVGMSTRQILHLLRRRLGEVLDFALLVDGPAQVPSPKAGERDGSWIARANIAGINIRTVGSAWNVVKYSLTLPAIHDAIHLLPIWEPGVVESLYGPCSWELSQELYSEELAAVCPWLCTPELQLRAVVNVLHACGRAVGMDVIPHTDRYGEMALCFPEHFEWLRRVGLEIVDHRADLHEDVQARVFAFMRDSGPAVATEPMPGTAADLFGAHVPEERRRALLFGPPGEPEMRERRRIDLVKWLRREGFEPAPATMAPPYRGLEVDPTPGACIVDEHGLEWREYRIREPRSMSRVFGPLARYKLYERVDDNARWEVDFSRPRESTWRYVCEHYAGVQRRFGFDFMRGDMSHVQMRPDGVPDDPGPRYDLLQAVKTAIRDSGVPWFGYFAESFLGPKGVMAYGDEVDHLEACDAEAALGNLQSMAVGSPEFLRELRRYVDIAQTRRVAPSLTVMTADKDDPRFDELYRTGAAVRLLLALFVGDMPSYVGLGFETRDVHLQPAPNEHYTKLYVFRQPGGPRATRGPYVFGRNDELFRKTTRLRLAADEIGPAVRGRRTRWLLPPDSTGASKVLAFTQDGEPAYVFLANSDGQATERNFAVPALDGRALAPVLDLLLSTADGEVPARDRRLVFRTKHYKVAELAPDECRIYKVAR